MAETFSSCRDGDTLAYILIPVFCYLVWSYYFILFALTCIEFLLIDVFWKHYVPKPGSILPSLALKEIEKNILLDELQLMA